MSHGIEKQDLVFSTKGVEWHGLARVVETIGEPEILQTHFDIIETTFGFNVGDLYIPMPNHKIIAADLRHRLDLDEVDRILPLHIPKMGYTPFSNREIYEMAHSIAKDLGMTITSMGTLEGCRKFFISIDTGDSALIINNRASGIRETTMANINLINSHDGELAQETYDSMIRIVCMNTFRWSREAKGEASGKVYHTKGGIKALALSAERIKAIIEGRDAYRETMEMLSERTISFDDALNIVVSFLAITADSDTVSSRLMNAAESIQNLYNKGAGNVGKSAYDLFNGATQYWTSGDGTGKTGTPSSKLYKANFGSAADHKTNFLEFLVNGDLDSASEHGKALKARFDSKK